MPPGKYDWMISAHWQYGFMSNYFDHLLILKRIMIQVTPVTMHTHTFNGHLSGTTRVKPVWILLKQEMRRWVSVASAGPYARLHLAIDI